MNKLPLSLAIGSALAFSMLCPTSVQAQEISGQNISSQDASNYIRFTSTTSSPTIERGSSEDTIRTNMQNRLNEEYSKPVYSNAQYSSQQSLEQEYVFSASSALTESGHRPQELASAGWAKDMPLTLAVRQVIPSDFSLNENGVALSQNVSWSGNLPWPMVLQDISRQGHFVSHINWDRKEVSLAPAFVAPVVARTRVAQPAVNSRPYSTNNVLIENHALEDRAFEDSTVKNSVVKVIKDDVTKNSVQITKEIAKAEQKESATTLVDNPHSKDTASAQNARVIHVKNNEVVEKTTQVAQVPVVSLPQSVHEWVLDPKLTLRENVEKWAKQVGWHVVWEGADYPIIAPASFSGDFSSPTGPLARLISAYESSDQPLVANLTTMDKVVYVKNKFYESPEVKQTSAHEISSELFEDPKH